MVRCRWAARGLIALLVLSVGVNGYQKDPYKVLGVRRTSSEQEIKQAFRRLSRQWHPDKNKSPGATEKFQEISAAYDFLSDPLRAGQAWDFGGPTAGPNRRHFPSYPDAAYYYAHNAYHTVLDLDPFRILELLRKWIEDQFAKNHKLVEPLWSGPVDQAVCKGLEAAWQLPQLLEPALLVGAEYKVFSYEADQWRTWRVSGVLLELSFWVGRQTPCLGHHRSSSERESSDSSSTNGDTDTEAHRDENSDSDKELLIELQQQLQQQRLIRQQLLAAEQQKQQSASNRSSSRRAAARKSSTAKSGSVVIQDSMGLHIDADQLQAQQLPGRVLWWLLLTLTACSFRHSKKTLAAVWVITMVGVLYIGRVSFEDEGAAADDWMHGLAAALESGSWQGWLIGSWFVFACFTAVFLLPTAVSAGLITASAWIWAAVSCTSIAMAPCLSRMGAGMWIGLKLWSFSAYGDPVKSVALLLGLAYILYKRPGLLLWWLGLLLSPVLFAFHFLRIQTVQFLQWIGVVSSSSSRTSSTVKPVAAQQQQQLQGVAQEPPDTAAKGRDGGTAVGTVAQDRALLQAATATATITTRPRASLRKRKGVPSSNSEDVAAAAAVSLPAPQQLDPFEQVAPYTSSRKKSSRVRRAAGFVFGGPWWPRSFGSNDLAATCHWWISMLGWELPTRVLVAGAFSVKLTLLAAIAALATASFGLSANWLTVQLLVGSLTCRVGPVVGLIWVLLKVLDDVARWMDPVGHAKKQKLRSRQQRGRGLVVRS